MILSPDKINKIIHSIPARLEALTITGSQAYGLKGESSDLDLVGIHWMNSDDFLEHPEFQRDLGVIRKLYDLDANEIFDKKSEISVDSFEWNKFITLWLKGSFVVYELLHFPSLMGAPLLGGMKELMTLMRENCPNKIGHAARGNTMHDWAKRRTDRKRCVMAYFRLLQALKFLQTQEFEANIHILKMWYGGTYVPLSGLAEILANYQNAQTRKSELSKEELILAEAEISELMTQVDRSLISTKLPDRVNKGVLKKVLQDSKLIRMFLIKN